MLIPLDSQVTPIDLSDTSQPFKVAQGSPVSDIDGTRQATLLFPKGTSASMTLPDRSTQPLTSLSVRATEYTVGENGPEAMPGELPPNSGYTYAVELSADEAISAGASRVDFDQPIPFYVENFLGFPTGEIVPAGYYDAQKSAWIPSQNGRIIEILSIDDAGKAVLDVDGSGVAADAVTLEAYGITNDERSEIASLYAPGTSLWRVPISHFTPWDCNWPFGPPQDAVASPEGGVKTTEEGKADSSDDCEVTGCIIQTLRQTLGEQISLVGLPFNLHYRSDRTPGRRSNNQARILLSGSTVPNSLQSINLTIEIAGRRIEQTFLPAPNQTTTWTWDGLDAYGRDVNGSVTATIRISYRYKAVYYAANGSFTASFAQFADPGMSVIGQRSSQEIGIDRVWEETWGAFVPTAAGLGGWTLGVHHAYNLGQEFIGGDGTQYSTDGQVLSGVITTAAGNGTFGDSVDGVSAADASLAAYDIAVAPDGSLYFPETTYNRIRRIGPDGIITTVAGTGQQGFGGDGGAATSASLSGPTHVALGTDGSIYVSDSGNNRIRRVDPEGIITTVAGNGLTGYSGDNGPAIEATLGHYFGSLAVGPDGSLFVHDRSRVRRIGPDGIITTVAGSSMLGYSGDGGPATEAKLIATDIAVGPDGSLYIAESENYRIRRVGPDGIITTVAGNDCIPLASARYLNCPLGDGGRVTEASLLTPQNIDVDSKGRLYIADSYYHRVRRVGTDGIITTIAGNGCGASRQSYGLDCPPFGDGGPATEASLNPNRVAVGPDGSLFMLDYPPRIRRVDPLFQGYSSSDFGLPSHTSSELYHFDASGRHLNTLDALTGTVLYSFSYTFDGFLSTITDVVGNITTIEREIDGTPIAINAPDGQRTLLNLDANGYLASVTDPNGNVRTMTYTEDGLMTAYSDTNGNTNNFTYDSLGRLINDTDPANGGWSLGRTELDLGYSVTMTSGEGHTSVSTTEPQTTGDRFQTSIEPDGTVQTLQIGTDGSRSMTYANGTKVVLQQGPDPRFGMLSPVIESQIITTPAGLIQERSNTRSAVLSDPNNRLSLVTLTETNTINSRTTTSVYDAASRTETTTTPVGRVSTATLDTLGRLESSQ